MEDNNNALVPVEAPRPVLAISRDSVVDAYEAAVIQLLREKPFFAKLVMTMKKDFAFQIPTAAVSVKSTGVTLHLNKEFFNSLTPRERIAILLHESLHLVHGHTCRFKDFNPMDHGTANVACDVAINQFIPDLPKKISMPTTDGKTVEGEPITYEKLLKVMPDLLPKQSSEYYFNKIKQEQQKNGSGQSQEYMIVDDHGQWSETDLTPEQMEKLVKGHVKAVLETCSDKERQDVDKTVIDELYRSDVNWKQQLRNFFCNAEETFTEATRKKRNRRYGILQPGSKNEQKLCLGIAVDTSGSISDEQLNMFFGEIDRIYDENTMVLHVMEADTRIQNCYRYKKGMKIEAKGRGGTAYNPAFIKAKQLKVDALIYMGDMDSSDNINERPKFPVLWAICGKQEPPANFGRKLYIE